MSSVNQEVPGKISQMKKWIIKVQSKSKQSYGCSMLFHRCSFVLLTWFKNISYFLLKGDANGSSTFCQLLVPGNNRNALYWSPRHFLLESYLLCILISLGSEKSGMRGWWCFLCFVQRMCKLEYPIPMSPTYIHYFIKQHA